MNSEKLTETQARIYLYIVTRGGGASVRDIARDLKLPPSTVHYNLKRLEELGYVARGSEGYVAKKPARLEGYVVLGRLVVPRLLVYGLFFTGVSTGTLVYAAYTGFTADKALALVASLTAAVIFYAEALKASRKALA